MELLVCILLILKVLVLCVGVTATLARAGYHAGEAACCGIVCSLAIFSFIYQCAFLSGLPWMTTALETTVIVVGAFLAIHYRSNGFVNSIKGFISCHRLLSAIFFGLLFYLLAQVLLLPAGNYDSMTYNLARVFLFQDAETILLKSVTTLRQAIFPVGSDVLAHLFLRYHVDAGLGVFSLLSYFAIIVGAFSASRHFVGTGAALLAALIIASAPELIYQATSTKNDIVAAAAAAACVVSAIRYRAFAAKLDLVVLVTCLSFGFSAKTTFAAFGLPFIVITAASCLWQHGVKRCVHHVQIAWKPLLCVLPIILVLSQCWLYVHNSRNWGGVLGSTSYSMPFRNNDGIVGAAANLTRYGFQSMHMLNPIDIVAEKIFKQRITTWLTTFYNKTARTLFDEKAICEGFTFQLSWRPHEGFSWFGPLSFLIGIPCVFSALRKKKLCAIAGACVGFVLIVSWQIAWMPYNNRFFSITWAVAGPCIAWGLQKMASVKPIRFGLSIVCTLLMFYACGFNQVKPLYPQNIWRQSDWGQNRLVYAEKHFLDRRVELVSKMLPPQSRVGILFGHNSWLFPYQISTPHVDWVVVGAPLNQGFIHHDQESIYRQAVELGLTHVLVQERPQVLDEVRQAPGFQCLLSSYRSRYPYGLFRVM